MTTLDEELAAAARIADEAVLPRPAVRGPDAQGSPPAAARRRTSPAERAASSRRPRQLGLLVLLLTLVGGTLALFVFGFKAASVYAIPIDELLSRQGELQGRRVRIDGELVPGSLLKRDKPCEYHFLLAPKGKPESPKLAVVFPECVVPNNFQDRPEGGVEVTAEGTMKSDGIFEAASILAKCSSRYDPDRRTMRPPE